MAGEMSYADLADYPTHAAVAEALGGELRPFDVYIGPYIRVNAGWIFLDGNSGDVVLWPGGQAPAYCEPEVVSVADMDLSSPWDDVEGYTLAAQTAIRQARERA